VNPKWKTQLRSVWNRSPLVIAIALILTLSGVALVASNTRADAFGSVDSSVLSQKPVHEMITRVLACTSDKRPTNCFEPGSMSILAGGKGSFGAVGEPDNPLDGFPNPASRHCDEGDYGDGTNRTQAEAWAEVSKCVALYQQYLNFSVASAAGLLNASGAIDPSATTITNIFGGASNACSFPDPAKGNTSSDNAKCNVLNGMGRALHIHEDVWSHSNWGDLADPATPIATKVGSVVSNPPGLGRTDDPSFLAYPGPVATSFPEGFITGCDDSVTSWSCGNRYSHSQISKDNGTVDPVTCIGTGPMTPRGKVIVDGTSNFQRAVTGACGAALRTWSDLKSALVATYGADAAAKMIHAISTDTPTTTCRVSGSAAQATAAPTGNNSSARAFTINVVNTSSSALTCGDAILNSGQWANYPANVIEPSAQNSWRTQSAGVATGTSGSVTFTSASAGSSVVIAWSNPFVGSNSSSCTPTGGLKCVTSGGSGNDATLTVTVSGS
jgi:hypothetical protein